MMKNWQFLIYCVVFTFLFESALNPRIRLFGEHSQVVYFILALLELAVGYIYVKRKKTPKE